MLEIAELRGRGTSKDGPQGLRKKVGLMRKLWPTVTRNKTSITLFSAQRKVTKAWLRSEAMINFVARLENENRTGKKELLHRKKH